MRGASELFGADGRDDTDYFGAFLSQECMACQQDGCDANERNGGGNEGHACDVGL
jgi:hypothetical protein